MRWTKIIGSHLIIWLFVSGIIGALLGPDVSDQDLNIENIAEQKQPVKVPLLIEKIEQLPVIRVFRVAQMRIC